MCVFYQKVVFNRAIYFSENEIQQRLEKLSKALGGELLKPSNPSDEKTLTSRDKLYDVLKKSDERYGFVLSHRY